jgi:hypothetical protein
MNRLNKTEPATFSILPCWAFFRDSVFFVSILLNNYKKSHKNQVVKHVHRNSLLTEAYFYVFLTVPLVVILKYQIIKALPIKSLGLNLLNLDHKYFDS